MSDVTVELPELAGESYPSSVIPMVHSDGYFGTVDWKTGLDRSGLERDWTDWSKVKLG